MAGVSKKTGKISTYEGPARSDRRGVAIAHGCVSVQREREACVCTSRLQCRHVPPQGSRFDSGLEIPCSCNGSLELGRVARDQLPQDLKLPRLRPRAYVRHIALVAPVQTVGEDDSVVGDGLARSDGRARRNCAVLRIPGVSYRSLNMLILVMIQQRNQGSSGGPTFPTTAPLPTRLPTPTIVPSPMTVPPASTTEPTSTVQ